MSGGSSDQKIVQSKRAVEIQTLNAQAEVEPLLALSQALDLFEFALFRDIDNRLDPFGTCHGFKKTFPHKGHK